MIMTELLSNNIHMAYIYVIYVWYEVCHCSSSGGELRGKTHGFAFCALKKIELVNLKKKSTLQHFPITLSLIPTWHFVKITVNSDLPECWVCSQDINFISHCFILLEEVMASQSICFLLKHYSQSSAFFLFLLMFIAMVQRFHEGSVCLADRQTGPAAPCLSAQNPHQDSQGNPNPNIFCMHFQLLLQKVHQRTVFEQNNLEVCLLRLLSLFCRSPTVTSGFRVF